MTNAYNTYNMQLLAVEAELLEETERRQQIEQDLLNAQTIIVQQAQIIHQYQQQVQTMLLHMQHKNNKPACARRLNFDL